ncbi:MAG: sulfatase-like hydrolase/transferase, partial [Pirellulaceae bacterium]|nr:sulfatase-like hydrolase/transferase [Pirellulaceae bacterium]
MKAGFQRFNADDHNDELDASEVTDLALNVLRDRTKEDRPFFSFIHYIDPHAPYTFHDELGFDGDRTALGAYDTEVVFCDAQVGRLLKGIDEMGIRDQTIVVLFADHGESFGEHNDWRHGASLREHQAHVPLMIRIPGVPPKRVSNWTTLADLPSTTIGLIGATDPHKRLGRDLSPLIVGDAEGWVDFAYAERPNAPSAGTRSKERAVWSGDLKLSWEPAANSYRVHNLRTDPDELRNIFDQSSEKQGRLAALLKTFDETIDSFWRKTGEPAAESDTSTTDADPLPAKFEAVVVPLEEARTPVEMKVATVALTDFLRSSPIRWNPGHHARLGVDLVDRLRKRAEEILPVMLSDNQTRGSLMLTLLFTDSATSVGVITD